MTEYITLTLPLSAKTVEERGVTVDGLFTALDHASAYHGHDGPYSEIYQNLDEYLFAQVREQLRESSD